MYSRVERNLDNDWPTAILFSEIPQTGNGWEQLMGHSCGGFSCDSLDGWAYLLPLCSAAEPIVKAIAEEQFCEGCENPSMDYFGSQKERHEQWEAYRKFLAKHGLIVSDSLLATVKQAAYPLDASLENLRILVGDNMMPTIPLEGLVILALGDNCD